MNRSPGARNRSRVAISVTWSDLFGRPAEALPKLVAAGVDSVRLIAKGFFKQDEFLSRLEEFGVARAKAGLGAFVLDLPVERPIIDPRFTVTKIDAGERYRLVEPELLPSRNDIPVVGLATFFHGTTKPGDTLEVADGRVIFQVVGTTDHNIQCVAIKGGDLSPGRSMKSRDLRNYTLHPFAISLLSSDLSPFGVSSLAISFVETAEVVYSVGAEVQHWSERPALIAKVETSKGVQNLRAIGSASSSIMLARGDLSALVEPSEFVDRLLAFLNCLDAGKPFSVATGVLASLEHGETPSIADISDVMHWLRLGANEFLFADFEHLSPTLHAVTLLRALLDDYAQPVDRGLRY